MGLDMSTSVPLASCGSKTTLPDACAVHLNCLQISLQLVQLHSRSQMLGTFLLWDARLTVSDEDAAQAVASGAAASTSAPMSTPAPPPASPAGAASIGAAAAGKGSAAPALPGIPSSSPSAAWSASPHVVHARELYGLAHGAVFEGSVVANFRTFGFDTSAERGNAMLGAVKVGGGARGGSWSDGLVGRMVHGLPVGLLWFSAIDWLALGNLFPPDSAPGPGTYPAIWP